MERIETIDEDFRAALEKVVAEGGRGTQAKIAEKAVVARSYINDILAGRRYGSESLKHKVAEACGFSYSEFLSYGGGKKKEAISHLPGPCCHFLDRHPEALNLFRLLADAVDRCTSEQLIRLENLVTAGIEAACPLPKELLAECQGPKRQGSHAGPKSDHLKTING